MKALEKPFRYALRLSLMVGFLVWHAIFWNHLAYLVYSVCRRRWENDSFLGRSVVGGPDLQSPISKII
ncbi:hypothetical protein AAG906_015206 [Vitis piasezkii]